MNKLGKCHCRVTTISQFIIDLTIAWPGGDAFDLVDWPADAPTLINPATGAPFLQAYIQRPAVVVLRRGNFYTFSDPYGLASKISGTAPVVIPAPSTIPLPRTIYGAPLANDPANTSASPFGHLLGSKPSLKIVSEQTPVGDVRITSRMTLAGWTSRPLTSTDDLGVLVPTDVGLPDRYPANNPDVRYNRVADWYLSALGVKMHTRLDLPPYDLGPDDGSKIAPGASLTIQVSATSTA